MDIGLLVLAVLDLGFGVLGLFGIQSVPAQYKGKSWTKDYMRSNALSEILMGVLIGIVALLTRNRTLSIPVTIVLIAVAVAPSLVWTFVSTKKYKKMLQDGIE